jgi:DNA-binding transcriptional LysR family regulator
MDVIKLQSFIAVAKLKNFRKASEELFFSQPAISAQIRELENYYNAELFERTGKRVELTVAGELLLPYAEELVRKFEESRYSVQNAASAEKGRLKIGTSILPGLYYLPDRISEFRELNPEMFLIYRLCILPKLKSLSLT